MKLYFHELCGWGVEAYKIKTTEIEAIEKEKTYRIESKSTWHSIIKKDDISKLTGCMGNEMFTLTPDAKPFIDALLARTECRIIATKQKLSNYEAEKLFFLAQQKKALAEGGNQ